MDKDTTGKELTREGCIEYAFELGYYSREQIESLWDEGGTPEKFFDNYVDLKFADETPYPCQCGNSTVMAHPHFGSTFSFGVAGACTCDGEADLTKEPIPHRVRNIQP